MGVYNYLLTSKTIRVKTATGRETLHLMKYLSKESSQPAPAWEQGLISRMDYMWSCRDLPKYVTNDDAGEGWPVYEEIRQTCFTDDYPSSRILAGFLRKGEGRMLTFEKWERLKVCVGTKTDFHYSAQYHVQEKLRESGLMNSEWTSSRFRDGVGEYVFVYVKDPTDLVLAKLVLAGDYTFADAYLPTYDPHRDPNPYR
jgi:hypothetical protein